MCCTTHDERDHAEVADAIINGTEITWTYAVDKRMRCQCKYGVTCRRLATQEDLLCDWCRDTGDPKNGMYPGHTQACGEMGPRVLNGGIPIELRTNIGIRGRMYEGGILAASPGYPSKSHIEVSNFDREIKPDGTTVYWQRME